MNRTILIIEDEFDVRANIKDLLEAEGYQVFEAEDGVTGLELIRANKPDLVITDVRMPEMSGWDVIRSILAEPSIADTPCIVLTAAAAQEDLRYGMELGADDYITKPFNAEELLKAVATRLKKREMLEKKIRKENRGTLQKVSYELGDAVSNLVSLSDDILQQAKNAGLYQSAKIIRSTAHNLYDRLRIYLMGIEAERIQAGLIPPPDEQSPLTINTIHLKNVTDRVMEKLSFKGNVVYNIEPADLLIREDVFYLLFETMVDYAITILGENGYLQCFGIYGRSSYELYLRNLSKYQTGFAEILEELEASPSRKDSVFEATRFQLAVNIAAMSNARLEGPGKHTSNQIFKISIPHTQSNRQFS